MARSMHRGLAALVATARVATALVPAALAAQSTPNAPKPADSYVIRNATIVPVVGPRIDKGTVVISGGKISAVGASAPTPAGATVIDGTGLFVYPGFIDSGTKLGLSEIESVPGGEDKVEIGQFNVGGASIGNGWFNCFANRRNTGDGA